MMDPQSSPWVNQVNLYWNGWWLGWWEWATPFFGNHHPYLSGFQIQKKRIRDRVDDFFCFPNWDWMYWPVGDFTDRLDADCGTGRCNSGGTWMFVFTCIPYLRDNSDCWWLDVWDWNLKPPIHGAYDSKTIQPRYSHQSQTPGNYEWKIIYSILGK